MNTALTDPYSPNACWTAVEVCYSESFAKFGKLIDDALKARPQISYESSTAKVGESFELAPSVSDVGADPTWSISPAPPAGLSFNRSTGVLSGVPTAPMPQTTYRIQAEDETGPGDTTFDLTVDAADPPPPEGSPQLVIRSNPPRLRVRGRIGSVGVTVSNSGDGDARGGVVCASVPKALRVLGGRCGRVGVLSVGEVARIRFLVQVPRIARTRSYLARFTVSATDTEPARSTARIIVPGR
jgi:hypothetical protein